MLNRATEPLERSKPRILLNILLAIFVGGLLGVGAALTLELLHRRIHSPEDIVRALDLPVLAFIEPETGNTWQEFWQRLPGRLPSLLRFRRPQTS